MTLHGTPDDETALCAHDLRGALAVVTGYVDLLQRPDLSESDRARAFAGIEAAIRRAGALLDQLAGATRPSDTEAVDVVSLAERAAQDAQAASGRVVVVSATAQPVVAGNAVSLARVLQNLLDNATKYAPQGDIRVTIGADGERATIEVADRGPGIPPEERDRVLEPRTRLVRDEDTPGSGLGLTVVKSVVDSLGGTLSLTGREGGGTAVRIGLPLA